MKDMFVKEYSSNYRIKGMCQCGHELTTMLGSESFGHTDTRGVDCVPRAIRVWIVTIDDWRAEEGETKADHLTYEEKIALADQSFSGGPCDGCGQELNTELDFAAHFVIKDRRYLNLGDCGVKRALRPVHQD